MGLRAVTMVVGVALLATGTKASAEEAFETTAVRHRLYDMKGTLEIAPFVGTQIFQRLTSHQMLGVGIAYDFGDSFALEVRAAWGLTGHTGLAEQVQQELIQRDPSQGDLALVDEMSDLWELRGTALAGIRWAPIYGKIALFAETPLHFQTYLWAGGGVGVLHRESLVYCREIRSRVQGTCGDALQEDRGAPVVSAALGFRFFAGSAGSALLEVRSYVFKDRFRVNVDRTVAEAGGTTGTASDSPGLTQVLMVDLGWSFGF
jgi:outer membrane beta-barrel protein